MNRSTLLFSLISILAFGSLTTTRADWPRFLGPNGNGIIAQDDAFNADWDSKPPKSHWSRQIGLGCSSFAIAQGKVLTLGNQDNKDTVWCFDSETGKVVWEYTYDEPKGAKYYTGGTSSTPTIDGDRAYTVSKQGKLFCFALNSGEVLWHRDYSKDFDGKRQSWGWAASPVVYGELLLIDPGSKNGSLVALNKFNGDKVWAAGEEEPGYSTPVIYQRNGTDYAAVFHKKVLAAYNLQNPGEPVFRFPWRTSYGVNATNPHYLNGKFYLGSGYGQGYAVIDITQPEPEIIHRDRERGLKVQTSLLIGDRVVAHYGGDGKPGDLVAIDFESGKTHWEYDVPGDLGNPIAIGDNIIVFTDSGHVILGEDTGNEFKELGRHQALLGTSWSPPAYADGKLFLRNNRGKAVCLDISK